jgi:serine phosphatase RsbU (regulator of sigma subunit)/CheY-like chemotaxis protein/anti-sigma regulatory factor (Ser/Thr protein kinase)
MTGRQPRVLIVDDNPEDIVIYSRWLRSENGDSLSISAVTSLQSALEACAADLPDCVLLDYDLRATTGIDVMIELERHNLRPAIIAITGSGSESIVVDFMRRGAVDYLMKSQMTAHSLCAAIRTQLSRASERRQTSLANDRGRELNLVLSADLERSAFLVQMEQKFVGVLDHGEVLRVATSTAVPFLADMCTVDLIVDGMLDRCSTNIDGIAGETAPGIPSMSAAALAEDTAVANALRTGRPFYLDGHGFFEASRNDYFFNDFARADIDSAAVVALRLSNLSIGVITFGTRLPRHFGAADQAVLEGYARRVTSALANARNAATDVVLRKQDAAAQRRLAFAHRISSLLARFPDWQTTLPRLMKELTISFNDSAAIFSVEQTTDRIRLIAAASKTPELEELVRRHYINHPPPIDDRTHGGLVTRIEPGHALESSAWAPFSEISVPLLAKGALVGLLLLVRDASRTSFDDDDLAVAKQVGRQVSTHLANSRRFEHEHGIATALQQALLPPDLPKLPDLLFAVRYFAGVDGIDVGGDWYDVVNVSPTRMVITIGDVIGSGLDAATAMGHYREVLRAYALEKFSPADILTRLNDLTNSQGGDRFATCALLVLDRDARRLEYASAGHPPPMLRLPGGEVRVLDQGRAMPIGAWRGTRYVNASVDMPVGATLVLYTDGLVETRQRTASEGVDLLQAALKRSRPDIELMLEDVLLDLSPSHSDDIAILAIEMLPSPRPVLKGWTFEHIDSATVDTIRSEFDAILQTRATTRSYTFGARIILDELLANVVRHAPGAFRLELEWRGENATLRIHDNGRGLGIGTNFSRLPDLLSTTGRGLFLVNAIGKDLKIVRRESGGLSISVVLPIDRTSSDERPAVMSSA